HLTGEAARVTGAQLSRRARGQAVEDYASVLLRTSGGVLGTLEGGNGFPRDGTDGEGKIAGRDGVLVLKGGGGGQGPALRWITASGEEAMAGEPEEPVALTALRDALTRWRRGEPPPIGVEDCARAVALVDEAYTLAS